MILKHPLSPVLVMGVLTAIPFVGCQKTAQKPTVTPTVLVAPVAQQDVPVVKEWIGSTDGFQNADIRAKVSGYLLSQNYQEGAFVKAGTILFQIDPRPFQAALAQSQATLAQAQAKATLAQTTLSRQTQLYNTKVISQQEFDTSTQSAKADIAAAAAAQADVDAAQLNVNYCTLTAPFDGIVGKAQAQIGDLVGGQTVLTAMSQVNPTRVYFPISEQEYLDAAETLDKVSNTPIDKREQRLEMKLANGSTYPLHGVFDFVNRQVDPTTGTITIAGLFPNPDNLLRPGQYAKVNATVDMLKNAMVIPQQAVNELQGTYFEVVVLGSDNKTQVRVVQMGERYNDLWVVKSGLQVGEKIVVEGLQKAVNGTEVIPKPYVPKAPKIPGQGESSSGNPSPAPAASASPSSTPSN